MVNWSEHKNIAYNSTVATQQVKTKARKAPIDNVKDA